MEVTDGLRPVEWDDYIGQATMKERLSIHINSALLRDAALDHILLTGPPGCGKTTTGRTIIGLENASSGTATLRGKALFGSTGSPAASTTFRPSAP